MRYSRDFGLYCVPLASFGFSFKQSVKLAELKLQTDSSAQNSGSNLSSFSVSSAAWGLSFVRVSLRVCMENLGFPSLAFNLGRFPSHF